MPPRVLASLRRRLRPTPDGPQAPREPPYGYPAHDVIEMADPEARRIVHEALAFTMTGLPRLLALVDATRYCVRRGVPGAFAECGVWRGGSVLAMILTLRELEVFDRDIYLFDTFEGMTEPSELDTAVIGSSAREHWEQSGGKPFAELFDPETFSEDAVRELLHGTGYPPERLHFVRGRVEDTIPARAPETLALLRLDTDWYESTRHELDHLYPALEPGGILIVDDYGHWDGSRRAVDEYLDEHGQLMLNRVDYSCRLAVKT